MTDRTLPTYKASYGLQTRKKEIVLLPVYRQGDVILWAGFNRRRQEIGILAVRDGRKLWPADPKDADRAMLVRCKFSRQGSHLVAIGNPDERRVTDISLRPEREYPPTSICSHDTYARLRSRARHQRRKRRAGSLVQWSDLVWPLSGFGKDSRRTDNHDFICALRAEGGRPVSKTSWTFD